jgi:hypothetical protein
VSDDEAEHADDGCAICRASRAIFDEVAVLAEPIHTDDAGGSEVNFSRCDMETQVVNR